MLSVDCTQLLEHRAHVAVEREMYAFVATRGDLGR